MLQAEAPGDGGELFVLDMGEPVQIANLAHYLIRLPSCDEGSDTEVRFTLLRPGEKQYEKVLLGHKDARETQHPEFIYKLAEVPDTEFETRVDELVWAARVQRMNAGQLRQMVIDLVPHFMANHKATPLNVVLFDLKRTGQPRP